MIGHIPKRENVECALTLRKTMELDKPDEIVRKAFRVWSSHQEALEVQAKVSILNGLWYAGVLNIGGWSGHIACIAGSPDFEMRLANGSADLVEDLARFTTSGQKQVRLLSAASKYCHFANPDGFAIYDTRSSDALKYLNNDVKYSRRKGWLDVMNRDLPDAYDPDPNKYLNWHQTIHGLRNSFPGDKQYSWKEIDQYLWLLGYALSMKEWKELHRGALVMQEALWNEPGWRKLLPP